MMTTLIASRPREFRQVTGTAVSVGIHVALIVLAVVETANVARRPRDLPVEPHLTYVAPPPATPAPPSTRAPAIPFERRLDHAGPVIVAPTPVRVPGADLVVGIPPATPVSTGQPAVSAAIADGARGATSQAGAAGSNNDGAPLTDYEVERAVQVIQGVPPRYPEMLRAAGVTGTVRVRFVVDTSGRVEPASMEIIDATRDEFSASVRGALLATRIQPAEANGHRVRQLVEQVFTFRLQR